MEKNSFSIFVLDRNRPEVTVLEDVQSALFPCSCFVTDEYFQDGLELLLAKLKDGDAHSVVEATRPLLDELAHLRLIGNSGIGVRLDDTDLEHFETIIRWNMAKSHFEITYQIEEDADVLREVVALVTSIVTDGDGGNLTFSFGENPQGHAFSGYDALVHLAMQFRFANQPISDGTFQFRPVFFSQVARSMGFIDTGLIVET